MEVIMYKVVRKIGSRYYSAGTSVRGFMLEYIPNEWTKAEVGGLLVFDEVRHAKQFMGSMPGYEAWLCEVKNEVELPRWRFGTIYMEAHPHHVTMLWHGKFSPSWDCDYWPDGTRAFKYVKPIKRVL